MTSAEAEGLIADALGFGIRTIIDVVPNHVSAAHPWFQQALAAGPGSPERERFWFRDGLGTFGALAPNRWESEFGGPAWSRVSSADGEPEQWYLHLFAPGQPDLNWEHPDVRRDHEEILRFWFDRGVAGIRIDSAALVAKDPDLPEVTLRHEPGDHPYVDRDELQEIYRSWREIADSYGPDRVLVGEVWLPDAERFARYLRPGVLHTAFNFDFMAAPWDAASLRASVERTLAVHERVGAPATWVLSNHDVTRPVTRYGRTDTAFAFDRKRFGTPTDGDLGRRRARAAALLAMALPGAFYLFQGEELGLPEVEVPRDRIEDPMHARSGGVDPGRDGCRVPLPWAGDAPPYGFSSRSVDTWLPQPADWAALTVEAQEQDPASMLTLYRSGLSLRRNLPELGAGTLTWEESAGDRARGGVPAQRRVPLDHQPRRAARPAAGPPRDPPRQRAAGGRSAARGHHGLAPARLNPRHLDRPDPPWMQGAPHAEPPTTRPDRAGDRRLARLPLRAGRLRRRRRRRRGEQRRQGHHHRRGLAAR